jgi:diaminopimelate decarboxylase
LKIACEPGTYAAASAGILVSEVNTVEGRRGGRWIGLDAGYNVNVYAAHYGIPHELISVSRPLDPPEQTYVVAGNINEAIDVFSRSAALPLVEEKDFLAFFPAGAYGASMASDHCMRGGVIEVACE